MEPSLATAFGQERWRPPAPHGARVRGQRPPSEGQPGVIMAMVLRPCRR